MRKCAAGALHGDCKIPGRRACGGAEDKGSARAHGDSERTRRIRSDAGRKRAERYLDGGGKAILGVHRNIDGGTCGTLGDGNGIRRQRESEIRHGRRRRGT